MPIPEKEALIRELVDVMERFHAEIGQKPDQYEAVVSYPNDGHLLIRLQAVDRDANSQMR
ncbi:MULTISPECIES: hypothetical protein [Halomonas]|uniref:hypothetical protein n=1 Tax=Halomonas TaxID=2745 RepID=UPI001866D043|nr:hypothetical protein [Halomonas citrativorans]